MSADDFDTGREHRKAARRGWARALSAALDRHDLSKVDLAVAIDVAPSIVSRQCDPAREESTHAADLANFARAGEKGRRVARECVEYLASAIGFTVVARGATVAPGQTAVYMKRLAKEAHEAVQAALAFTVRGLAADVPTLLEVDRELREAADEIAAFRAVVRGAIDRMQKSALDKAAQERAS